MICKKFKKGSLTIEEARSELEEQMEFLSEEHVEDMEQMFFEAEDTYDYMMERKLSLEALNEEDDYPLEEDLQEEELWDKEDE